ncbi:MAG TPA: type II toxin-antitoxin system HicA family toxin [Dehalococcoidia bacterium]|nr:type II toxin-antitoxin system HicA family toxin [Dehalococcoidia bacterium]
MDARPSLVHLLRNTPVRQLERALRRDGFELRRQTRTGSRMYVSRDGRTTTIHFHHASDTLPPGTLGSVLEATRWTEDDARRLGLL